MDEFLINYYDGYKYEDLNNEEQINIKGPTSQNRRLTIKFKLDAIKLNTVFLVVIVAPNVPNFHFCDNDYEKVRQ